MSTYSGKSSKKIYRTVCKQAVRVLSAGALIFGYIMPAQSFEPGPGKTTYFGPAIESFLNSNGRAELINRARQSAAIGGGQKKWAAPYRASKPTAGGSANDVQQWTAGRQTGTFFGVHQFGQASKPVAPGFGIGIYKFIDRTGKITYSDSRSGNTGASTHPGSSTGAPKPAPAPNTSPVPASGPVASPAPAPAPGPVATPGPIPLPAPKPAPAPGPVATPNPVPAPTPTPAPPPAPPIPAPGPVATPPSNPTPPQPGTGGSSPLRLYPASLQISKKPQEIAMPRPSYLQPVALPGLDTSIVRVTDAGVFGGGRRFYRHAYSKRQAWNSDGSRILLAYSGPYYLLDGKTFKLLQAFDAPSGAVWSNLDPDVIYGTASPASFVKYRVSTKTRQVLRSFPEYNSLSLGGGEGNMSNDDRYVPLIGSKSGGTDVLIYDTQGNTVVSKKEFPGLTAPNGDIDWVSVSPSGRFVVVNFNKSVRAYDVYDTRTMSFLRRLDPRSGGSHSDFGYDSSGNEIILTRVDSTALTSIRLSDGVVRQELSANHMASNQHISCRNINRPGWCYISTFSVSSGLDRLMYGEIFALKLDGSGTIERFSQNFSAELPLRDLEYDRQPHAVPNRDGTQVLFASDWNDASSSAVIHTYVAGRQLMR